MKLHPGAVLVSSLAAAGLLEAELPRSIDLPLAARLSGAGLLMTLSAVVLFWGLRTLESAHTPSEPNQKPLALVTTGPFRLSRNPMYASVVVMCLGWTFLTASFWFAAATAVVFALLNFVVIPREEASLKAAFPAAFDEWARQTRRWL